jgi:hypothetical protein
MASRLPCVDRFAAAPELQAVYDSLASGRVLAILQPAGDVARRAAAREA